MTSIRSTSSTSRRLGDPEFRRFRGPGGDGRGAGPVRRARFDALGLTLRRARDRHLARPSRVDPAHRREICWTPTGHLVRVEAQRREGTPVAAETSAPDNSIPRNTHSRGWRLLGDVRDITATLDRDEPTRPPGLPVPALAATPEWVARLHDHGPLLSCGGSGDCPRRGGSGGLVQTTFERALRAGPAIREPLAIRAWLLTVQTREALRVVRRLRRTLSLDPTIPRACRSAAQIRRNRSS